MCKKVKNRKYQYCAFLMSTANLHVSRCHLLHRPKVHCSWLTSRRDVSQLARLVPNEECNQTNSTSGS